MQWIIGVSVRQNIEFCHGGSQICSLFCIECWRVTYTDFVMRKKKDKDFIQICDGVTPLFFLWFTVNNENI